MNTFSIVAKSSSKEEYGVAVATARPNVGSLVPFVGRRGAIATQARVNTELGRQGLLLLEAGVGVRVALGSLLATDQQRELRQVHGVDSDGVFAFTGQECVEWAGHREGRTFSVAGNMLTGSGVLDAMARGFAEAGHEDISWSLLSALEAGLEAGGDKRGKQSAALLVSSPQPRMYHNLRVDDHPEPVAELRRIHGVCVAQSKQIEREYGPEGLRLFSQIKLS